MVRDRSEERVIGRALRTEWYRVRIDRSLPIGAALALVLGLSVVLGVPDGLRAAPEEVRRAVFAELGPALLINSAVVAGILGSFGWTADLERGVIARQLGFLARLPLLGVRAVTATLAGAVLALVAAGSGSLAFGVDAGLAVSAAEIAGPAAIVGAAAGFLGLAVGAVVGRHLLALFAVPMLLAGALPVAGILPWALWASPLGTWLLAVDSASSGSGSAGDTSAGVLAGAIWLIVAAGLASLAVVRRDIG
jgi:hypothetical protein